jgi:hypothetical protein
MRMKFKTYEEIPKEITDTLTEEGCENLKRAFSSDVLFKFKREKYREILQDLLIDQFGDTLKVNLEDLDRRDVQYQIDEIERWLKILKSVNLKLECTVSEPSINGGHISFIIF